MQGDHMQRKQKKEKHFINILTIKHNFFPSTVKSAEALQATITVITACSKHQKQDAKINFVNLGCS